MSDEAILVTTCPKCGREVWHESSCYQAACFCGHEFDIALSPFAEDKVLAADAERLRMILDRRQTVVITDEAEIAKAGLIRSTPDYNRIRNLLLDGKEVSGARLGGYEYLLRRQRE